MKQLLTANVATHLYWLGRYLERIESTLIWVMKAYDFVIDVDKNAGIALYKKFGIDLEYSDSQSFLNNALLGEHTANIYSLTSKARENAIICRSQIDAEAFGEIMELNSIFDKAYKNKIDINHQCIDSAHSLIREIWGSLSRRKSRQSSDYFFRLGKIVEELDFYLRFGADRDIVEIVIKNIDVIIKKLSCESESDAKEYQSLSMEQENIMFEIDKRIAKIIVG
ncbi:alpha-E domain-containing protein [Sulfurimonas sp.]|uniref:alpha-E domain-containing protein n=1 Tax=Sulfurimonas sp. TaxID=2022749 RepID=UPI0025F7DF69|nr:alpha-E domain-containing protein [Sulfurimonas sp.]MDD5157117.1 alpha-E domain-containing protein [Sulfurimonas sp.]